MPLSQQKYIETNDAVYTRHYGVYSSTIELEFWVEEQEKQMSMLTMFRGKKDSANSAAVGGVISSEMAALISRQCASWKAEALAGCTVKEMKASFKGCKREVEILDSMGKLVVRGREFHSGEWLFWLP